MDKKDIPVILKANDILKQETGIALNINKTKLFSVQAKHRTHYQQQFHVVANIQILGIKWCQNLPMTIQTNAESVVNKAIAVLKQNYNRFQYIENKVKFVNAFIYSMFVYQLV